MYILDKKRRLKNNTMTIRKIIYFLKKYKNTKKWVKCFLVDGEYNFSKGCILLLFQLDCDEAST